MKGSTIAKYEALYGTDPVRVEGRIKIPYKWHVGRVASRFFIALRDRAVVQATRCESCAKTLVPPRQHCPFCAGVTSDLRDIASRGTVESYTVVHQADPALAPRPVPYALGLIRLDGADTSLLHLLDGSEWTVGDRVEAVFASERVGSIRDIAGFRKVKS